MTEYAAHDHVRAIVWRGDVLELLDQRLLPQRESWIHCRHAEEVAQAIRDLVVRGAPAIGVAAAYGVVLAAQDLCAANKPLSLAALVADLEILRRSRPTAVNLFWALDRMQRVLAAGADLVTLDREARAIDAEDLAANRYMGALGASLIAPESGVLTHCNTGSLATAGFGTALGVIRAGFTSGNVVRVFACETRPWLQGARLTAWELLRDGIPAKLIADSAGAHLMSTGAVDWLIVGADRITANGDTANKIGTYQLAIAARYHGVKVMVVAPSTTVDMATATGAGIHIELRDPNELLEYGATRVAAAGAQAWNPVFDVTPASLIDAIVTEKGIIEKPDAQRMAALFS